MGYHLNDIKRGIVGEFSKVVEELYEFKDALDQGSSIMALIELADLYGAVDMYLSKFFNTTFQVVFNISDCSDFQDNVVDLDIIDHIQIMDEASEDIYLEMENFAKLYILLNSYVYINYKLSIKDLYIMSQITRRVFESGHRK